MIFIKDGLKTLINGDFKILDDFWISQKYNPKIPKNDTFSFLGTFLGKWQDVPGWEDL